MGAYDWTRFRYKNFSTFDFFSYLWSSYGAKHSTTTSRWEFVSATQLTDLDAWVLPFSDIDFNPVGLIKLSLFLFSSAEDSEPLAGILLKEMKRFRLNN